MKEAEFEGRSEEEALLKASHELGVNIADMTWEVLERQDGIFGMFGKAVKIRVRVADGAADLVYRQEYVPGPGDTGLRHSMGGRNAPPDRPARVIEEDEEAPAAERPARPERAPRPERPAPAPRPASTEPSVPAEPKGPRAKEVLEGLLSRLEIEGEVTVRESDDEVALDVRSAGGEDPLAGDPELLSAVQFLVNKIVNRFPEGRKLVVLDAGGQRNKREVLLGELARRLGNKALATRKVLRLAPMNAQDRRLVHMALKDAPGVTTHSQGEDNLRSLLVVPDGFGRR